MKRTIRIRRRDGHVQRYHVGRRRYVRIPEKEILVMENIFTRNPRLGYKRDRLVKNIETKHSDIGTAFVNNPERMKLVEKRIGPKAYEEFEKRNPHRGLEADTIYVVPEFFDLTNEDKEKVLKHEITHLAHQHRATKKYDALSREKIEDAFIDLLERGVSEQGAHLIFDKLEPSERMAYSETGEDEIQRSLMKDIKKHPKSVLATVNKDLKKAEELYQSRMKKGKPLSEKEIIWEE